MKLWTLCLKQNLYTWNVLRFYVVITISHLYMFESISCNYHYPALPWWTSLMCLVREVLARPFPQNSHLILTDFGILEALLLYFSFSRSLLLTAGHLLTWSWIRSRLLKTTPHSAHVNLRAFSDDDVSTFFSPSILSISLSGGRRLSLAGWGFGSLEYGVLLAPQ